MKIRDAVKRKLPKDAPKPGAFRSTREEEAAAAPAEEPTVTEAPETTTEAPANGGEQ